MDEIARKLRSTHNYLDNMDIVRNIELLWNLLHPFDGSRNMHIIVNMNYPTHTRKLVCLRARTSTSAKQTVTIQRSPKK